MLRAMIWKRAGDGGSNRFRPERWKGETPPGAMIGMGKRDYYKNTNLNMIKIFKTLQNAAKEGESFLPISQVARRSKMHKWTVSRTVDLYMHSILEIVKPEELEAIGLQAKLIRLKNPNMTTKQLVNYLKLQRKLNR